MASRGEPGRGLGVAADIAAVLGYAQTNNMNKLIDESDKDKMILQIGGNYANQSLINESGLYQAIFSSTKHGGYIAGQGLYMPARR